MTTHTEQELLEILGKDAYNEGAFMFSDNKMRWCFTTEQLQEKAKELEAHTQAAVTEFIEELFKHEHPMKRVKEPLDVPGGQEAVGGIVFAVKTKHLTRRLNLYNYRKNLTPPKDGTDE